MSRNLTLVDACISGLDVFDFQSPILWEFRKETMKDYFPTFSHKINDSHHLMLTIIYMAIELRISQSFIPCKIHLQAVFYYEHLQPKIFSVEMKSYFFAFSQSIKILSTTGMMMEFKNSTKNEPYMQCPLECDEL